MVTSIRLRLWQFGTQATVKSLTPEDLIGLGAEIVLANTYHLYLRPGHECIERLGGLHSFMHWDHPILTDSGRISDLQLEQFCAKLRKTAFSFQSHIDGSHHVISPEGSIAIQQALGADIIMCFDECAPYPSSYEYTKQSVDLTTHWAERCWKAHTKKDQALFGIVPGRHVSRPSRTQRPPNRGT